jgi:hypothetical protein
MLKFKNSITKLMFNGFVNNPDIKTPILVPTDAYFWALEAVFILAELIKESSSTGNIKIEISSEREQFRNLKLDIFITVFTKTLLERDIVSWFNSEETFACA